MATQKQCEIALEQFADALSRLKNVVGLGVVQADDEGNRRNCAVGVYVKKKVPIAKLSAKDLCAQIVGLSSARRPRFGAGPRH